MIVNLDPLHRLGNLEAMQRQCCEQRAETHLIEQKSGVKMRNKKQQNIHIKYQFMLIYINVSKVFIVLFNLPALVSTTDFV